METRGEGGLDEKDQIFKLSALGKGVFFCYEKCNFQGIVSLDLAAPHAFLYYDIRIHLKG